MGRLLDALRTDSEPDPVATPATPATFPPADTEKSQSRKSRSVGEFEKQATADLRARLRDLADDEGLDAKLVHALPDADLLAIPADYTDRNLRAYLRALDAARRMDAGMIPLDWGEPHARTCEGCGPVLLWETCPDVVKACPWCFRRRAGKAIPRPKGRQ